MKAILLIPTREIYFGILFISPMAILMLWIFSRVVIGIGVDTYFPKYSKGKVLRTLLGGRMALGAFAILLLTWHISMWTYQWSQKSGVSSSSYSRLAENVPGVRHPIGDIHKIWDFSREFNSDPKVAVVDRAGHVHDAQLYLDSSLKPESAAEVDLLAIVDGSQLFFVNPNNEKDHFVGKLRGGRSTLDEHTFRGRNGTTYIRKDKILTERYATTYYSPEGIAAEIRRML